MSPKDPWPGPPYIFLPEPQSKGIKPGMCMLNSDLPLHDKFTVPYWRSGPAWQPWHIPMKPVDQKAAEDADLVALRAYIAARPTNIVVPNPPKGQTEEKPKPFWDLKASGPSLSSKDGGTKEEWMVGKREYLKSGYTRTNPDGTHKVDNDFGGKWEDKVTLFEGTAKHEFFDVGAAKGKFGDATSTFSGDGRVFGADAKSSGTFKVTTGGADISGGAKASGSVIEGGVKSNEDNLVSGGAKGSAVSGSAEAKGEVVLKPDQATLGGKLGAEVNLIEGEVSGRIHVTPRRVANPVIHLWNWATDDKVPELSENWDIGIMVGGTVSGQVGAQAGAEAKAGYEKGKLRAEAGAKIGLGVGAGVKVEGGVVGVDKIWAGAKSAWNWAWGD